jgi:hypothetical protein
MHKIIPMLLGTLCLFTMAGTSKAAALAITITSPIALATSEEGNAKVEELYSEHDAHALAEMVDSGEAMLLRVGTVIVWPNANDYHNGCVAVHVRGSSDTIYITAADLRSSTNFTALVGK